MMFPYYPLSLYIRNNIETIPNFNLPCNTGNGLCNQIFSLVTGIIKCSMEQKSHCIIDSFNCCIEKGNIIEISKIINLDQTTININKIKGLENIKLFDRADFKIELIDARYGIDEFNNINVKTRFDFTFDEIIDNMNQFFGNDPYPGIKKYLYAKYMINDKIFITRFDENSFKFTELFNNNYILNDLFINKRDDFSWYNRFNKDLFSLILKNIRFTDGFYEIIDKIKENHQITDKLNVIHFRLEQDAINHWSVQNNMDKQNFQQILCDKYEALINNHIERNDKIYVLSAQEDYIIEKFSNNHELVYTSLKTKNEYLMEYYGSTGRELCGIIDLLIGINCSKLFIGCHSYKLSRGSSFSYAISENVNCKRILIDLDNISNLEEIYD